MRVLIPGLKSYNIKLQENHGYVKDNRTWTTEPGTLFDHFFTTDYLLKKAQGHNKLKAKEADGS